MKTIEEIGNSRAIELLSLVPKSKLTLEDVSTAVQIGICEANSWISVKDELPEENAPCIVKNLSGNMCICFMKYLTMVDERIKPIGWFNYWYGKNKTIEHNPIRAEITHWRYIERKNSNR